MKAGYDARERARKEKEREREEKEAHERREEEERNEDLQGWALKMRKEHEVCAEDLRSTAWTLNLSTVAHDEDQGTVSSKSGVERS